MRERDEMNECACFQIGRERRENLTLIVFELALRLALALSHFSSLTVRAVELSRNAMYSFQVQPKLQLHSRASRERESEETPWRRKGGSISVFSPYVFQFRRIAFF